MANEYRFTRAQLDEVVRCAIATALEEAKGGTQDDVDHGTEVAMTELFTGLDAERELAHHYPDEFHMTLQLPPLQQQVLDELHFGVRAHRLAQLAPELSTTPAFVHQAAVTALKQTIRRLRAACGMPAEEVSDAAN